jgi:hypothetical protein
MLTEMRPKTVLLAVALAILGFFIISMSTRVPFYTVSAANTHAPVLLQNVSIIK